MLRLALQTLRFRKAGFAASFVALALGAAIVMACGGLLESGVRATLPPQRLTVPQLVVTGDQGYRDQTLPERVRLDSRLVAKLASLPGVARAVPDVSFPVAVVDGDRPLAMGSEPAGHGWASVQLTAYRLRKGRAPRARQELVFDATLAARTRTRVGDRVTLSVRGTLERFRVVGIASARSVGPGSIFFFGPATPGCSAGPAWSTASGFLPDAESM